MIHGLAAPLPTTAFARRVRRIAPCARAVALAAVALCAATRADAQVPMQTAEARAHAAVAAWDPGLDLRASERARVVAALVRAEQQALGGGVSWSDTMTRASGQIVPLRDEPAPGDARCRQYRVTVAVPVRTMTTWQGNTATYGNAIPRPVEVQVSPAFTRAFTVQTCGAAEGGPLVAAGR